jgi:hypothetical protein
MKIVRSFSLDAEVFVATCKAAEKARVSVSRWVEDSMRLRLRSHRKKPAAKSGKPPTS